MLAFTKTFTGNILLIISTHSLSHLPKPRNAEAEITGILLFHPRPTPPAPPTQRVSLSFQCDIRYSIFVGSGGGRSCDGATPNVSMQSSVHNSSAFAMLDHERQTHDARESVRASQNERIEGTTSRMR
mmetsp:Transcript_35636/g.85990  ORF Transcript_35636/g.85990 Transcript_35636/m.85990 type:complete len:128 (-) Transcript_35636:346-729(-)